MNAPSFSASADFFEDNNAGSDSDTNTGDAAEEYYQPIASMDDSDDSSSPGNSDEEHHSYFSTGGVENGISSLHLNGDGGQRVSSDHEEEEEEEIRSREAYNSAIERAIREDERRRNAPLSAENATRVREAMRGISFGGSAPDWASRVPEDQWINQLRALRQSSNSP